MTTFSPIVIAGGYKHVLIGNACTTVSDVLRKKESEKIKELHAKSLKNIPQEVVCFVERQDMSKGLDLGMESTKRAREEIVIKRWTAGGISSPKRSKLSPNEKITAGNLTLPNLEKEETKLKAEEIVQWILKRNNLSVNALATILSEFASTSICHKTIDNARLGKLGDKIRGILANLCKCPIERLLPNPPIQTTILTVEEIRKKLKLPNLEKDQASLRGREILSWILKKNHLSGSFFADMLSVDPSLVHRARKSGIKNKLANLLASICNCSKELLLESQ